jgi:hypothetical protein
VCDLAPRGDGISERRVVGDSARRHAWHAIPVDLEAVGTPGIKRHLDVHSQHQPVLLAQTDPGLVHPASGAQVGLHAHVCVRARPETRAALGRGGRLDHEADRPGRLVAIRLLLLAEEAHRCS